MFETVYMADNQIYDHIRLYVVKEVHVFIVTVIQFIIVYVWSRMYDEW